MVWVDRLLEPAPHGAAPAPGWVNEGLKSVREAQREAVNCATPRTTRAGRRHHGRSRRGAGVAQLGSRRCWRRPAVRRARRCSNCRYLLAAEGAVRAPIISRTPCSAASARRFREPAAGGSARPAMLIYLDGVLDGASAPRISTRAAELSPRARVTTARPISRRRRAPSPAGRSTPTPAPSPTTSSSTMAGRRLSSARPAASAATTSSPSCYAVRAQPRRSCASSGSNSCR